MWEISRTVALSAAGVATALILLLAQIGVAKVPLQISMWCAALALPLWLGFWQICETYVMWDELARSHYESPRVIVSLTAYFMVNCLVLSAGMAALLWNFLPSAALGFIGVGLVVAVAVGAFCHAINRAAQRR